jgi:hypothetical protein
MSTRDNASTKKKVLHLNPASYTTTQTPADGAGVDTRGFESVQFDILVGAVADLAASPLGDGTWTFKVQEADSDVNASYADITDAARILITGSKSPVAAPNSSTGVFLTLVEASQNNVFHVGVISAKRYLRMIATAVTTPGASLLAITATLEHADRTPVTN